MRAVRFLIAFAVLTLVAAASPSPAQAHVSVQINLFHDSLAPYGRWIETPRYGWIWTPRHVAYGWRPYTAGHWVFTEDGWAWVSDEPWGWAVYHYGRWYSDPVYGWAWVPGPVWAPAWVAWRYGGGVIGWAPLPPVVGYDFVDVDFDRVIAPTTFIFVRQPYFVDPVLTPYIFPASRNVSFIRITKNVTRYKIVGSRVVNEGVRVDRIQKVVGHKVPKLRIRDAKSFTDAKQAGRKGKEVAFFRPKAGSAKNGPKGALSRATSKASRSTLLKRQRHETQSLRASHVTERSAMKRHHAQALRKAHRGERLDVMRHHRAEGMAQRRHEMRDWNALQSRHRAEREALRGSSHGKSWTPTAHGGGGKKGPHGHAPAVQTAGKPAGGHGHGRKD